MKIRSELPEDFLVIYQFVKRAFETAAVADGDEQDYVEDLRGSAKYIPDLALVAEAEGEIVGHLMLTDFGICKGTTRYPVLLLAPLSVELEHRKKGVGAMLVEEGFDRARALGHTVVVLVGNPGYYSRFGFVPADRYGIVSEGEIPPEFVLACELVAGALEGKSGVLECFTEVG